MQSYCHLSCESAQITAGTIYVLVSVHLIQLHLIPGVYSNPLVLRWIRFPEQDNQTSL